MLHGACLATGNTSTSLLGPQVPVLIHTWRRALRIDICALHMCRYTNETRQSATQDGANGSAIYFLGRFYDNLFVKRKGVTSLSWPKPKLTLTLRDAVRCVSFPSPPFRSIPGCILNSVASHSLPLLLYLRQRCISVPSIPSHFWLHLRQRCLLYVTDPET